MFTCSKVLECNFFLLNIFREIIYVISLQSTQKEINAREEITGEKIHLQLEISSISYNKTYVFAKSSVSFKLTFHAHYSHFIASVTPLNFLKFARNTYIFLAKYPKDARLGSSARFFAVPFFPPFPSSVVSSRWAGKEPR